MVDVDGMYFFTSLKLGAFEISSVDYNEDFILLNGDTWLDVDIKKLFLDYEKHKKKTNYSC